MKLVELTEKEYRNFIKGRDDLSFMQMPEVGNLRKIYGSEVKYLGIKDSEKVVAASLFLITTTFMKKKTFYAPRGFLLDYNDSKVLKTYLEELKKYCKKNNGLMIKIDPNINYQIRDNKGEEYPDINKNDKVINDLKKLGFIHYGFNTDLIYTQSRWNVLLSLDKPYEEVVSNFSKSTRKNIEEVYRKGLKCRVAKKEDLAIIQPIFDLTAERKDFNARDLDYYKNMFECLGDKMRIYIAYLEPDHYLDNSKENLRVAEEELKVVLDKMAREKVGNKLKEQEAVANKKVDKCKEELELAKTFKKEYPKGRDIAVLVSIKSGPEYLTLYSGYLTEYARFTPKYMLYNEHIKDAYEFKMLRVNFYGITGIFDPKDKNYGMYDFKRGFGGEVQELIGEFTYPLSWHYHLYMMLRNLKRKIKKVD